VWTQPDRPSGRGNKLTESPVKAFALAHGLTVHQPAKLKIEESKALFSSHDADVAVVVAYGRILPAHYLSAPRRGCINVHFSSLPHYRGAAPVNWAIVNGEEVTGVTTMFVAEELDAGPILLQAETGIGPRETAPELMARLSELGAEILSQTLRGLDTIVPREQDNSQVSYAPILRRENGAIDWSHDAFAVERRIRGFQPWPNAFTDYQSKRLIVWKAEPKHSDTAAVAGEVIVAQGDNFVVNCGEQTALRLLDVQSEGARRMSARDFLNGSHVRVGDKLGPTS
jgi:methionyl-tRNA formyltransferase